MATLERADAHARIGLEEPIWPPPLLHPFDAELAWRLEQERWHSQPGVTFDRAMWDADQARMRRDNLFTDHYRGATPPWVVVPGTEVGG
jgi:hypothetical protein